MSDNPLVSSPLSDEGIAKLIEQWRAREMDLCRRADAQYQTGYAQRLGAEAEGIARCADQLEAFWRGVRDGRREEPAKTCQKCAQWCADNLIGMYRERCKCDCHSVAAPSERIDE